MNDPTRIEGRSDSTEDLVNMRLLKAAIRLNTVILAVIMGLGSGFSLFFATHLSILIFGNDAGRYLRLLGVFLPGYSVTPMGAWIGLFWAILVGAFSGSLLYWLYVRDLGPRVAEHMTLERTPNGDIKRLVLRISSHALGRAFGCLMALQIFLTTNWLILRGTADESVHARLLSNYLIGYSVSFHGSLIGALDIFVIIYVFSWLLGEIYNFVITHRETY